jgi:DNA-binding MarR family transcriptional regulator
MDELARIAAVFLARRRKAAEHLREFNITLQQMHLIQLARQKGAITPSAAAEELACDRPTMTLIVEKCLDQGWLAKKAPLNRPPFVST